MGKRQKNKPVGEQKFARWQKEIVRILWISFFVAAAFNTHRESFGPLEWLLLVSAGAFNIWCMSNPLGGPKIILDEPGKLKGEFARRPNWYLMVLGFVLFMGGLAGLVRMIDDLRRGYADIGFVLNDIAVFTIEYTKAVLGFLDYDMTSTRMYALMVLLPIGALLLFFNAVPLLSSTTRFQVEGGRVRYRYKGAWHPLEPLNYRKAYADGTNIVFTEPVTAASPTIQLPQERVFSQVHDTRVKDTVLARYFLELVKEAGFTVTVPEDELKSKWAWDAVRDPAS
jgi:hypothetical protein